MKLPIYIGILTLSLISSACSLDGPTGFNGSPHSYGILPLAVGNRWIGKVMEYDSIGNVSSTRLDTLRVTESRPYHGEIWYYMNVFWYRDDTTHRWFTNRADGLYSCDGEQFNRPFQFVKYPAKPGDVAIQDSSTNPNGGGSERGREVDTTDLRITVPAGTFQSYLYRFFSTTWGGDLSSTGVGPGEYYAPTVGPILIGYFDLNANHSQSDNPGRTWQLVRAELH